MDQFLGSIPIGLLFEITLFQAQPILRFKKTMKPRLLSFARLSFPLATAIAALISAQSASAATFYWDSTPTPATAGFGTAGGTWSSNSLTTGDGRWTTSATGIVSGSASQGTSSADAFNFGTATDGLASGSITIGGSSGTPINVGSITFGSASGTITLNGGFLAFGASKVITVNNTTNTISSVIQGSNGFTKNGAGTLILTGNLTHTGLTSVANGGTLVLSGDNSSMSGGVSLSTAGTGTAAPKLNINSATAIGTGTLAFGGGAATDTVQIDNTSAGAITLSTNNATTLNRNFTFAGTQSLNMGTGTATIGGLTTGTQRSITVTGNTLTFGGTVAESVTNVGINKGGAGTLLLAGTNSYTGTTTVSAGTLQLDGSTHASSTVAVGTSGTLTGTGTVNGNATLTGSGTINKSSGTIAGTLGVTGGKWNGAGAVTGLVTSSSGTFTIGNGANLTANGDLAVTGGTVAAGNAASTITGNVNYTSGSNSSFAGIIAGSGKTLTLNNAAATLTLSGANTYTGVTNVNAGFLTIGSTNALGTTAGNTVIASGGQVYMSTASLAVAEPFNIAGSGVSGTAGAINFSGSVSGMSISGAVTLSGAATIKGDGSTGSTFTGGIDNAGNALTFTLDGGATSTVSTNGIVGGGSLTKASTGTLNLNVASSYSGGTQITGGIISVATSATALGGGDVTFNGGTRLAVAAGLNVANNIIIGSNTGGLGRGLLESSGTGTATLSGDMTINATPAAGGTFASSSGNDLVVSGLITASVPVSQRTGTVTFSGGGTGYSAFSNNTGITKVGALNGIATTATVTINSAAGAGSLDLNGFNQNLVGISRGSASFTSIIGNS
ncbi:MAG: toxins and related Ca2+-binding domain, partial [Verrucomicrobiota bacterium]